MSKINYVEMGKRIQAGRKAAKLTQAQLAEKVDVAPSYISEIERGTSISSLAVIVKISEILKLNLDNLVRGVNKSNAESTFQELLNHVSKENHELFIDLCTDIANRLSKK